MGFGGGRPDFALRGKHRDPLTGRTKLLLLGAMAIFGALPYAEEMLRCLRRRPTIKAQPVREEQELPAVPDPVELAVEIGVMPCQCFPFGLPDAAAALPEAVAEPDSAPSHENQSADDHGE